MDWITKIKQLKCKIAELEAEVEVLQRQNLVKSKLYGELFLENKELSKRPVVYCAKRISGELFMVHDQPMVFLSIENAKKWFATVPIYDNQFEIYTGEIENELVIN